MAGKHGTESNSTVTTQVLLSLLCLFVILVPFINGDIVKANSTPTLSIPGLGKVFGETVHFTTEEYPFTDAFVDVYRGIRYAEPPVGDRRFAKAVASGSWDGEYNATYFRPACPQSASDEEESLNQSEDCLFINVWTPHPKVSHET